MARRLERLRPRLALRVRRSGVPPEDAEDVLQQALLVYATKRPQPVDLEAWLAATVRNRCHAYWRSRRRQVYTAVDAAILDAVEDPESPPQERRALRLDLERVFRTLPSRCRSLLSLRYGLGYRPAEAAECLGYRRSGIYKILHRCVAAFSRQLCAAGLLEERP